MKAVGTGLDRGVEHSLAGADELGAESGSLDFEFLDGIHRWKDDKIRSVQKVHGVRIVINAVE